jgi:hypothetical protein
MLFTASAAKKVYDKAMADAVSDDTVMRRVRGILTTIRTVAHKGEVCVDTDPLVKDKIVLKLKELGYTVSESGGGTFIKIEWK